MPDLKPSRIVTNHAAQGKAGFDPESFAGTWKVIEGSIPQAEAERYVILETSDGLDFKLYYQDKGSRTFHQDMRYNPKTRTLDASFGAGKAERCISFWDCGDRQDGKCRIFAIRRMPLGVPFSEDSKLGLLPFERPDDNGTWGAEEG